MSTERSETVRIGCGAGFWGDTAEGPRQLVESAAIDYLILDYLAEITMSLLAKARAKDASLGYATDFPDVVAQLAPQLREQGIRVITNGGGVNPAACKAAIDARLRDANIDLKVAIVTGDDLLDRVAEFRELREMFSGAPMPDTLWSMNAYLGAFPIAKALADGADIVLTGRCVDSALALGPLIHEFGWRADDYDRLAGGSLAGHVIECGVQATGGILTDWETVQEDWDRMGFPIAECSADGRFVVTKPPRSGGRVSVESVCEQIVYEIGDPGAYLLPDVCCDFRSLRVEADGENRVAVSGARGVAPGGHYKVSATWQDGFRSTGTMMIGGVSAVDKAEAVAAAVLRRTRRMLAERGFADYRRSSVEVLGAEANWGPHARARATREVILKLAVHHDDKRALQLFSREFLPSATSMAQGITGFAGGRPTVTPLVRLFSCLVPKASVKIEVDGQAFSEAVHAEATATQAVSPASPESLSPAGPTTTVPLIAVAYGRSGDKGDSANIGILARRAEFLPVLRQQLSADMVREYLAHLVEGDVLRYEWSGLGAFNFLLSQALGGGGMASLRHDPQGKMLAQILMDFPLQVPRDWVDAGLLRSPA